MSVIHMGVVHRREIKMCTNGGRRGQRERMRVRSEWVDFSGSQVQMGKRLGEEI